MSRLLHRLLERLVESGSLEVVFPDATRHRYGDGSGTLVSVRITDRRTARAIAFDPSLAIGEGYVAGTLQLEAGGVYELVALLMRNLGLARAPGPGGWLDRVRHGTRLVSLLNDRRHARLNVARHYDLDDRLFDLFLDPSRQYSCAYFAPGDDLTTAQRRKMAHIAAKLRPAPGHRVLDVGCGWGGLARFLAETTGASVTGITLSPSQLAYARRHDAAPAASDHLSFALADYRDVDGTYDRIVSVGMLEHVGRRSLGAYFARIAQLLAPDGVALVHTIGRSDGPGVTNPFIRRYIFPGGYFPALSELLPTIERSGLMIGDVEVLRLHYAETLRAWRERFMTRAADATAIYGAPFCRMWEFYLAGSEAAFRHQGLVVFQVQLLKRPDAVPIRRDYIVERERELMEAASGAGEAWRHAG